MHKYTSNTDDASLPLGYIASGLAPIILVIIIIGVIGFSKINLIIAIILSSIVDYILFPKLFWRELTIDNDKVVYVFKIKPVRVIDTVIRWDQVMLVEFHPYITPRGADWNLLKGLEPERKLLRLLGEGNKRLLSTNITDFGSDDEIRKIIEDIYERKGIPCRQMWKEWGKK